MSLMRLRAFVTAVLVASASLTPVRDLLAQRPYTIGPVPHWVDRLSVDITDAPPSGAVTNGSELLLIDRQDNALSDEFAHYSHLAFRLFDEGAVQENLQIEIVVDTSYETLILHTVRLRRGEQVIDQLKPAQIQVMQREPRLEFQLYDGSLSLVLFLQDVRQGDVVEYSFTRSGSNPVLGRHYMTTRGMESGIPIHRMFFRTLWPRERQLYIKTSEADLEPIVKRIGDRLEYVWDRSDVPAQLVDSDIPYWYAPFATVQLSDFETWSAVAAWGDSLFDTPTELSPELNATIDEIRTASSSTLEQARKALQFVQDEIRYLGLEIGVNSHVPQQPATVLERRFGDCKDKSLLLITMLDELGVDALPALVSTRYASHVGESHPSAELFNHMIVRAQLGDDVYWLDPSTLHERGGLEEVAPDYGAALVLDPSTDSLSVITPALRSGPLTDISVRFGLHAIGEPASMRVRTIYSRTSANQIRGSFKSTSVEKLEKQYLEYYSRLYPTIESEVPLEVVDLEDENVIRMVENYSIKDFWDYSDESGENIGEFYPLELGSSVPSNVVGARTTPLGVSHPVHIRYEIEAAIEEGWAIPSEHEVIETPAVRFTYDVNAEGKLLTLTYEYETLADHVSPDDAPEHVRKMGEIDDLLTFYVSAPTTGDVTTTAWNPEELNWLVVFFGLVVLFSAIYAGIRVYRLAPTSWPQEFRPDARDPNGLGGWLVLLGIGVSIAPLALFVTTFSTLPSYGVSNWNALTTPGWGSYHPMWAPVLMFELLTNILLIVFSVVQLVAFFRRKRIFPGLYIVWACGGLVVSILDTLISSGLPGIVPFDWVSSGVGRDAVMTLIWVAYMSRSERVRNTFTN